MRNSPLFFFCAAVILAGPQAPANSPSPGGGISIIPRPVRLDQTGGEFTVTSGTSLVAQGIPPWALALLQDRLRAAAGVDFRARVKTEGDHTEIRIVIDSVVVSGPESYRLSVTPSGITLTGGGIPGACYGVQTLLQLIPPVQRDLKIPCCLIEDSPRFRWRGMHLDVSRHFFPVEFIKSYIDVLAMHKLNVFHWHLTDDQGWRIEIKKYPELTRKGAWRVDREDREWGARPPEHAGEQTTYGGFYTQDEIRDVVRYAGERCVTIVPEIEMPAHTLAALAAYPAYSCTGGPFSVPPGSYWPISTIFCAGNDSTFAFLDDVLTEVIDLFPGEYIHIGGDEADKSEWKKCPKCQARIRAEGLRDESDLQGYFMKRIESFVRLKGRRVIGWDEILEGGLPPRAAVMSWRGSQGGIDAARMGHKVVMSPGSYTYLSQSQGQAALEPPSGGGFLPLDSVYAFEPVPDSLTKEERTHILGAEGCLWSEYIPSPGRALYMLLPRLAALSEVLWTRADRKDWRDFLMRMPRQLERYDARGYPWARSGYSVRMASEADRDSQTVRIVLSTGLPADSIVYTTDGSVPGRGSLAYASPFVLRASAVVRASALRGGEVFAPSTDSVLFHKAVFKDVKVTFPSTKYTAGGVRSLTDGLFGSLEHADGRWQGYEGVDFEAVIDLGKATDVSCAGARFLQKTGAWIFFPSRVSFALSLDGREFTPAGSFLVPQAGAMEEPGVREWDCSFPVREARFVRVTALNIGTCPSWHPGAGGKSWLFVDELIVR